jgi:hypothetical protein
LRARTKVHNVLIKELLFADKATLSCHTKEDLQRLMGCFAHACREFGLTLSIRKNKTMGQDVLAPPSISIDGKHFTYLGSTISNNLSLNNKIDQRIAKTAGVMARLNKMVLSNKQVTLHTKP